jgi:hypothetical protein
MNTTFASAVVDEFLQATENIGDQVGSSGHMARVSLTIDKVDVPMQVMHEGVPAWEITFIYTISIESEFTIYPENPPREHTYQQTIIVDGSRTVLHKGVKKVVARPKSSESDL